MSFPCLGPRLGFLGGGEVEVKRDGKQNEGRFVMGRNGTAWDRRREESVFQRVGADGRPARILPLVPYGKCV